jgi:uncharacterized protein YdeI (YjbR/CyaY-like superfamily)
MTWPEAVGEALCIGWIDAVSKSIDTQRYMIRFTKRRPRGIWSSVNIARGDALTTERRMRPAGLRAFADRTAERSGVYSHEQTEFSELTSDDERAFHENAAAWEYFQTRPGSYRKAAIWSILSAKRDETKRKRLAELIDCSARRVTVPRFTRPESF